MRGNRALVDLQGFGDLPRQDVEQQRLRALLEEIPLADEIMHEEKDDADHEAQIEHEEPGDEGVRQPGRRQVRLKDGGYDQQDNEAHDPEHGFPEVLDQQRNRADRAQPR